MGGERRALSRVVVIDSLLEVLASGMLLLGRLILVLLMQLAARNLQELVLSSHVGLTVVVVQAFGVLFGYL